MFIVEILLLIRIATAIVVGSVCQEVSKYLLDVFQGFLLSLKSLLLCLHAAMEVIIIVVVGHVSRYEPCSH